MSVLEIKDLHVEIEGKEILKGVNLTLKTGEIAAIMGPNGTGKSTLSAAIMGNPNYEVTKGEVLFDGVNILELEVDERARMGRIFLKKMPNIPPHFFILFEKGLVFIKAFFNRYNKLIEHSTSKLC